MKKSKSNLSLPPFVALTWEMLNHRAYIELPASAKGMLPYFIGKVRAPVRDPAHYTTIFNFTYSEAQKYGCAKRTFFKIINDLMRYGFISPVEKGGLRGVGLSSSSFRLSVRWKKYGTAAFEKITWGQFGGAQLRRQVQNMHRIVAQNELEKDVSNA
jgi:hypothetical protein